MVASRVIGQILAILEGSALHCRRNVAELAFEPENVHDCMLTDGWLIFWDCRGFCTFLLFGAACRVRVTVNDFLGTGRIQSIVYSMKPREREREPEDV